MSFWDSILASVADLFERVTTWLRLFIYQDVICQHFCLFKEAGSNFKNCHVHILVAGAYPVTSNPHGYSGLGHDDSTPGLADPAGPRHNSVSKGNDCRFRQGPGRTIDPIDLEAYNPFDAHFYPAPAEGACFPGYDRLTCPCGDICVTFNPDTHEAWERTQ